MFGLSLTLVQATRLKLDVRRERKSDAILVPLARGVEQDGALGIVKSDCVPCGVVRGGLPCVAHSTFVSSVA
jgi:hypothetical protein